MFEANDDIQFGSPRASTLAQERVLAATASGDKSDVSSDRIEPKQLSQ